MGGTSQRNLADNTEATPVFLSRPPHPFAAFRNVSIGFIGTAMPTETESMGVGRGTVAETLRRGKTRQASPEPERRRALLGSVDAASI
jgi:hypothetical protein